MEGFLPTPDTGFGARRQTLPGLERFLIVGQWVQPGGGLPSGLTTARAAIQSMCRRDDRPFTPLRAALERTASGDVLHAPGNPTAAGS
jgi:hypothetical protein